MPLTWTANLDTGIEQIDVQHRVLVDMVNELETAHAEGKDPWARSQIIPRIADYALYHFEHEESLFDLIDPDVATHPEELETLRRQSEIDRLEAGIDSDADDPGSPDLIATVMSNLADEQRLDDEARAGQPHAEYHLQEHRKFSELLSRIQLDTRRDDRAVVGELVTYVKRWLVDHLLCDRKLARLVLAANGPGTRSDPF